MVLSFHLESWCKSPSS